MRGIQLVAAILNHLRDWHLACDTETANNPILKMSKLLVLAILLLIVWVVLKVALAITSVSLHLLWIVAIVLAILWVVGKIRGTK